MGEVEASRTPRYYPIQYLNKNINVLLAHLTANACGANIRSPLGHYGKDVLPLMRGYVLDTV